MPDVQRAHRSSRDQKIPVGAQNPQKPPARRGNISGHEPHEPRLLVKRNSRDKGTEEGKEVDGEKQSRNRRNSAPPDNRQHHPADHRHRPSQGGPTGFIHVSANESWALAERWVNSWWSPNRGQVQVQAQVQVRRQWTASVRGGHELRENQGQREGDNRGRGRRSSDAANHPTPTPTPAPRHTSTPSAAADSLPVIPARPTTSDGMGLRNLLRKRSRSRRKILFYHKHEPYYGFTNFSPHPVMYHGKRYPTSEHLFQSFKFVHKPHLMEHIRTCSPRPSVAFAEARRFAHEVHPNWKYDNIKAMDTVLYHKFTQHNGLMRELLATGDAELIENSDKDSFWGCGSNGMGRNELGKALERLRKHLREQMRR